MLNGTRLLGCVAAAWLLGGGVGNAASITLDGFLLTVTGAGSLGTAAQVDTADITGTVNSHSALAYTADWVEFHVTPTTLTTATVDVLANPRTGLPTYPGETFQVTSGSVGGPLVFGPAPVTNIPVALLLTGGTEYFLELASGTPPGLGQSQLQLSVEAPLPAALPLFAAGLGLFGFAARRRKQVAA